jgi:hypothetical protein
MTARRPVNKPSLHLRDHQALAEAGAVARWAPGAAAPDADRYAEPAADG